MQELSTEEILNKIFRDNTTLYGLKEFSDLDINEILKITLKDGKYFLKCFKREKDIQVFNPENNNGNPEEIVRQLWLWYLRPRRII